MRKKLNKVANKKAQQKTAKAKKDVRFIRLHVERNAQEGMPLAMNGAAVGGRF